MRENRKYGLMRGTGVCFMENPKRVQSWDRLFSTLPFFLDPPVLREDVSARMLRKLLPRMNDSPDWLMVSSDYMRLDNIGEVTDYRDVFES
jgi:hypothetical protein